MPTTLEAETEVARAISRGLVVRHPDVTVGPYHVADPFAMFVDRGAGRGVYGFREALQAAIAFVDRVGAGEAVALVREARDRSPSHRADGGSPLDGVPVKVGARLAVVTGNRAIGIDKGAVLNVDSVRLGERNSVAIRVSATRGRKVVTLHARHVNRLSEPEFSLGDGSGTNKIVVRVSRAAR
jgi:hypothetical protein